MATNYFKTARLARASDIESVHAEVLSTFSDRKTVSSRCVLQLCDIVWLRCGAQGLYLDLCGLQIDSYGFFLNKGAEESWIKKGGSVPGGKGQLGVFMTITTSCE